MWSINKIQQTYTRVLLLHPSRIQPNNKTSERSSWNAGSEAQVTRRLLHMRRLPCCSSQECSSLGFPPAQTVSTSSSTATHLPVWDTSAHLSFLSRVSGTPWFTTIPLEQRASRSSTVSEIGLTLSKTMMSMDLALPREVLLPMEIMNRASSWTG